MIRNNIKIAWRSLWKNKGFSAINIIGLSVGMAAVLLIGLWVQHQFLYDNFYPNTENIYKVMNQTEKDGEFNTHDITMGPLAKVLKENYSEVAYAARYYWSGEELFQYQDKQIKSTGNEVDPDFVKIFDFGLIQGSTDKMLDNPNSIVLTKKLAESLFGDENPLNKTITMGEDELYTVTAVIEDLPEYTDFDFTFLVPLKPSDGDEAWRMMNYHTFVTLKDNTNVNAFNNKIRPLINQHEPVLQWTSVFLYPMSKTHLYSQFDNGIPAGGQIAQVRLVSGIGLLILLIACINFINLSTARSQKRAKEVGVRKVIGAGKISLVGQFLTESLLISTISGILAIGLSFLALPLFNKALDHPLVFDWANPLIWVSLFVFILITGLLAGAYPAFVLSAFQPVTTLKGLVKKGNRSFGLREVLVVFQFGIAIVLIVATIVIRSQIQYASKRDIGYNISQLIEIPIEGAMDKSFEAIKNELISNGIAKAVTRTGWTVARNASSTGGSISWQGATPEQVENARFILARTESDFVETMGLTLMDGRDLDYARFSADSTSVLLNEVAIKEMKLENPVGQILKWGNNVYTIVGVFNDYISGSPYAEISPMLITASKSWMFNMVIRTNEAQSIQKNLQDIEAIIKKFNPSYPFSYSFVDQKFAEKFKTQEQTASLSFIFSSLAIVISCLGLFGLASYIAETRTKEIGVRKVLGASVLGIGTMLSKDFVKLVLLSIVIAIPIAWYLMHNWLADFSYRVDLKWWVFALAGGLAIMIALLTVSTQAIKAAMANPVDSLRDE